MNDKLFLAEIVNKSNERLRVSIQPVYNFQWLEKIFKDEHIGGITLNPGFITLRCDALNSNISQIEERPFLSHLNLVQIDREELVLPAIMAMVICKSYPLIRLIDR